VTELVRTSDGRTLAVDSGDDPAGRPVLALMVAHARWLAGQIPGVEARLLEGDGHLTLLHNRVGEVHEWLLAHS
jgi:hypothetical protein